MPEFVLDASMTMAWCFAAAYLDLALRENLPLASLDNRLRTAAGNVGVPLVNHARP